MLHPAIVVQKKGAINGYGLFTNKNILKNTQIWKLTEPTFTWAEVQTWHGEQLSDFKKYGFQCGNDRYSLPRGRSREMNHSCDPNTWWSGCAMIIARRDIYAGEEITYDYASCDIDLVFEMTCCCGSTNCRRKITNQDYLDSQWQIQYGLNLPPHVLHAINNTC